MRFPFMPITFALLFSIFVIPAFAGPQGQKFASIQDKTNTSMDEYFKFGVGTTWTYKKTTTHGDNNNGMILFNTFDASVAKVADGKVFMGSMILYTEGEFLIAGSAAEDGSVIGNLRVMKSGMKAGDIWDGNVGETSDEMKATFVGMEDVETPAGKFKAAHVSYTAEGATLNFWHAAKVGMVKLSIKTDKFSSEQVLQKYSIK